MDPTAKFVAAIHYTNEFPDSVEHSQATLPLRGSESIDELWEGGPERYPPSRIELHRAEAMLPANEEPTEP